MNINLEAVRAGQISYADLMRNVGRADLHAITGELFDELHVLYHLSKRNMN